MGKTYNKLQTPELKTLFNTHDILLFTETWLNEHHDCTVEGFTHYTYNRALNRSSARRNSGGIIMYVSNELSQYVTVLQKKTMV